MPNFVYPTNREMQSILPEKVARLSAERVGLQIMPTRHVNAGIIQWNQKDNYRGLQQLRGLDGAPQHVIRTGSTTFNYNPGVYGEFSIIGETELTLRAGGVTQDVPISIEDLVLEEQDRMIQRELDRIEQINWLAIAGTFSISSTNGVIFTDTFNLQTYSRITAWATVATAVPLQDFRAIALLGRGNGVNFGAGATAYMNRATANTLIGNTNTGDLGGKRVMGGNSINNVPGIATLLQGEDLPQLAIYDEGYYDETNAFQLFIPNNRVFVIGKRPAGDRIGEYLMTRNLNNPNGAPGRYNYVLDRTNATNAEKRTPPNIEIHQGHNGGPVIYHPKSIIVMTV